MTTIARVSASSPEREEHVEARLLANAPARSHVVQFYDDDGFLCATVAQFLTAALRNGQRALLVAGREHAHGILARMDSQIVQAALGGGQLLVVEARRLLSRFMVGDMPDPQLFEDALAQVLGTWASCAPSSGVVPRAESSRAEPDPEPSSGLRAFGEMVDLLIRDGNARGALRLEELWNAACSKHGLSLLCAYRMGNFDEPSQVADFHRVCAAHTHVLPTESYCSLGGAEARLRQVALLEQRARLLDTRSTAHETTERALRDAVAERTRLELDLQATLAREREALSRAAASDAFKELFVGSLGHDLRNPLNAILTTARLMTARGELAAASQKRVDRIVSSGVRLQRMIEQILDVTGERLNGTISVHVGPERDLAPLAAKLVDEQRLCHPGRSLELQVESPCRAAVDAQRIEQVLAQLIGNALTHGDPQRPVRVTLLTAERHARVRVHNWGPPIDAAALPLLFDPFRRVRKPSGRCEGLGFGLYISERIVRAHGGSLHVQSSERRGTLFEIVLPQA